jgi:3-oxoadipate enol-lactonase
MRVQAASSTESASLLGWSPGADPALIAALDAHARAVPAATSLADWLAADAFDRLHALDALDAPTLILAGADDPLTPPKYAQHLAAKLPDARVEFVSGAGHMLPLDQAPRIAPFVRDFVAACA